MALSTDYSSEVFLIRSGRSWKYRNLTIWKELTEVEITKVSCQWSEWSEGECSQTCGGGRKAVQRRTEPPHCLPPDIKMLDCNTNLCPGLLAFMVSLALLLLLGFIIIVVRVKIVARRIGHRSSTVDETFMTADEYELTLQ